MCGGISKHGHRVPGAGIGGRGSCAVERWAGWGLRNEEGGEGLHRGGWGFVARNGELGEASAWETLRGGVPRVEGGREEPPCQGNASAVEEGSSSVGGAEGFGGYSGPARSPKSRFRLLKALPKHPNCTT